MNKNLILKVIKVPCGFNLANKGKYSTRQHMQNRLFVRSFVLLQNNSRRKKAQVDSSKFSLTYSRRQNLLAKTRNLLPTITISRGLKTTGTHFTDDDLSQYFIPVEYEVSEVQESLGEDIVGPIQKEKIVSIINKFYQDEEVKELAKDQGLDKYLFRQTIISFRKFCVDSERLPTDLHILFSDIIQKASHIHDLYPYVYKHAKDIFPHLNCMDDLRKISDLSQPPNWYPEARKMNRKIIYHAGPTNSGKTYHAMEQFLGSDSGVYCGPLKLLAVEVYEKSNNRGTSCDLVTGEERKYAISEDFASSHIACTVEMTSLNTKYEVAIIDEIQMIKDPLRGWAWTRALLGLCAKEIHICGEDSAIELVRSLAMSVGEDFEVRRYKRLTPLHIEDKALMSLDRIEPGDCIVCFGRQMIHKVSQAVERLGHEVAVIYGGLPPTTKLAQAKKFNDPDHPCKIMVATDAIGMGLNLSIRRIIFSTLVKIVVNEKGEKEMETIGISSALQIAGRAGRYGTKFEEGYVTTLKSQDLPVLKKLLSCYPPEIEQAGLHPTAEQIELFAFHLPNYTLSNLLDIFTKISSVDSSYYFMCSTEDFKFLADLIQHVQIPLRARYVFCCSPINKKAPFVCAIFLKFARKFSLNEPINLTWLCNQVKWPFSMPKSLQDLIHLEEVFDLFDLYLWLSYRFPDMFPDADMVRGLQQELDNLIQLGVTHITQLLKNSENNNNNDNKETKLITKESDRKISDSPSEIKKATIETLKSLSQSRNRKSRRRSSLAESLVKQGIISQKMLNELRSEFKEMEDSDFERIINNIKGPRKPK